MVLEGVKNLVRRTCTDITGGGSGGGRDRESSGLEAFRETSAYVLLGAPGSGKTTEFDREAGESGGVYVTARDFLTFDRDAEWRGATLFIDALDETRAGSTDGRTALDAIRAKLARLGCPKFRLSCREADWFGANDRHHLEAVSPDGSVGVLHLDPLTERDAKDLLKQGFGVEEPDTFIGSAHERGVDGMLVNPQSLGFLARAVRQSEWPSTRTKTFELACANLVRETNRGHRIAVPQVADTRTLLGAAGKLFAVQLLTGASGYERLCGEGVGDYLALEDVADANADGLRRALGTRLFVVPEGERAVPLHRHIAEFLAARFLAERIGDGLPVGRVLALMAGFDGVIVSELRGLCAWLAAQSPCSRTSIIARDPLGTVMYGDVQGFTSGEKRLILNHLERGAKENPWLVRAIRIDSRLGDLVFPGVEKVLRERTRDSQRDGGRQAFVYLLVEMFAHGGAVEGVAERMLVMMRDGTWRPEIRYSAIDAYVRQQGNEGCALDGLKALAQDVYAGEVADPDDNLLGTLLDRLYPEGLSESEVLGYLRAPKRSDRVLAYECFWERKLGNQSTCEQLARLLDKMVDMRTSLYAEAEKHGRRLNALRHVPANLLERILTKCKDEPDPKRLFDWLGVAGWVDDRSLEFGPALHEGASIGAWIGDRPELHKALMELGVKHCLDSMDNPTIGEFVDLMWNERGRRRFNAPLPLDFASWCLDQAVVTDSPTAGAWFMHRVAEALHRRNGKGVSRREVDKRIAGNESLQRELDRRLDELKASEQVEPTALAKPPQRLDERQRKWQERVRASQVELRENRADARLLHELAQAYLGGYWSVVGGTPRERLNHLIGDVEELVEAVLAGFRGALSREDLPSDDEVIRLGAGHRMHVLSYPFLAGLNEVQSEIIVLDGGADGDLARLALALHYNVGVWPGSWDTADGRPWWYGKLLEEHPELVAEVLIRSARSILRKGRDFSQHLFNLAYSADHKTVACLAVEPLLSFFPVRCAAHQLASLRHLLVAACLCCQREALVELMERKLGSRSMNMAQRVYWLGAGLIVRPGLFVARLESYVEGKERRVLRLSQFLGGRNDTPRVLIEQLGAGALALLIRTIGALHHPYSLNVDSEKGVIVSSGMEAADRVHGLINLLASDASAEASAELERLSLKKRLEAWRTQLADAKSRQKAIRRDASFVHASVEQVLDVLSNRKPANASDLAAVTMDHLRQIAGSTRDGTSSGHLRYWNVDPYNRAERPRPENACRDALLSDLQHRLGTLGIDVQPEGRYADENRADLRISYGGINVPIEIKKSCHPDLWSGIRRQLIARYTRDPGADGHGIYVVFWFGETGDCQPTPGVGGIPASAADVEQRLVDELSEEQREKIGVCVIDVAKLPSDR